MEHPRTFNHAPPLLRIDRFRLSQTMQEGYLTVLNVWRENAVRKNWNRIVDALPWHFSSFRVFLIACAPQPQRRGASFQSRSPEIISIIDDLKIQSFVTMEGRRILQVTGNRDQNREYRFYLAQFKNPNWIGAAAGSHVIYIQINAARNAYLNRQVFLPGLRRILAHEIAHDLLTHPKNRNNSAAEELEADRLGIILWKRLGWDCSYWIQRYETKQKKGITSTLYPTELQLRQAKSLCPEAEERKRDDLK